MKNIKKPLVYKLIIRIGIPLFVIYLLVLLFTYTKNRNNAIKQTKLYLSELTKHNASALDAEFKEIEQASINLKNFVSASKKFNLDEFNKFTEEILTADTNNIAMGISFKPNYFENRKLFSPFVFEEKNKLQKTDISKSYNYTKEDWYLIPYLTKNNYWTEPFFGKISKSLLSTFTVPITKNNEVIAIAFADLSLDILSKFMNNIKIMSGNTFLISKNGTFLYHPQKELMMKETIFSIAEEYNQPHLREIGQKMVSGNDGIAEIRDFESKEKKWLVYTSIPSNGWCFAAVISENEILASVKKQIINQSLIMIIGLLIILVAIIFVSSQITKPLTKLANKASEVAEGNLDTQITQITGKDEIHELALSFNKMTSDLKQHIKQLTNATRAREAVESELRIARQIQESLLPRTFPAFPDYKEFDLFAKNIPAKEVAGDFYDFFFLDDENLVIVIADVSGKGISAGLFMAVTRTLIKTACEPDITPDKVLNKANRILCQDNDACMFTTLFLAYFNIKSGEIRYSNAGHDYPFIIDQNRNCTVLETQQDIALGIDDEHEYHLGKTQLKADNIFVLYTDGVIEATANNQLYGEERFKKLLIRESDKSLEEIAKISTDDLNDFQKGQQFDDITLLLLKKISKEQT